MLDQTEEAERTKLQGLNFKNNKRVQPTTYFVGNWVYLTKTTLRKNQVRKFLTNFTGPYQILEVLSKVTVRIQLPHRSLVFNVGRLKPFVSRDPIPVLSTDPEVLPQGRLGKTAISQKVDKRRKRSVLQTLETTPVTQRKRKSHHNKNDTRSFDKLVKEFMSLLRSSKKKAHTTDCSKCPSTRNQKQPKSAGTLLPNKNITFKKITDHSNKDKVAHSPRIKQGFHNLLSLGVNQLGCVHRQQALEVVSLGCSFLSFLQEVLRNVHDETQAYIRFCPAGRLGREELHHHAVINVQSQGATHSQRSRHSHSNGRWGVATDA
uniref:Tf2-1-like SH3-like domain-containing protein n=1 Tax=Timema douglasi TaxID=61478 RepID=A0A7R8VSJ5_TIMDO|nr:unnamed protein product [Timema douglasi]